MNAGKVYVKLECKHNVLACWCDVGMKSLLSHFYPPPPSAISQGVIGGLHLRGEKESATALGGAGSARLGQTGVPTGQPAWLNRESLNIQYRWYNM